MPYLALYRKYRPKSFTEVVGQSHVVKTLQNALKSEKVAHAYLFCGPRGVGKTTVARLLAKAINCEKLKKEKNKGVEPCNKCDFCQEINEGRAIDLIEIDAASNRGIDEIRELKENIKFTPNYLKYKVFIIDEVHMLTIEAFNALLKTLEEPPAHAIFILATTEPHKIPATILSRCQRFDFKKLAQKEIAEQLSNISKKEKIKIDKKSLNLISSNASGSSRDALSLLNQIISLEDKEITFKETKSILGIPDWSSILEFVDYLISKDTKGAIKLINNISDAGYDLGQFFKNLLEYFRKLLLVKIDCDLALSEDLNLTNEQLDKLKKQSQKFSPKDLIASINHFIKAKKEINEGIIPQLPLEIAVIEATYASNQDLTDNKLAANAANNIKKDDSVPERVENKKSNKAILKKKESISRGAENNEEKKEKNKLDPEMISNIQTSWLNFIHEVSRENFSLGSFLKVCDPIDIQGNKVVLVCKYSFHKEKLRDLKNKNIIENTAEKFFKTKVIFDLILYDDLNEALKSKADNKNNSKTKQKEIVSSNLEKQALNVFGGNVI